MKRHLGWALALGIVELLTLTTASWAEPLDEKPLDLAIMNVPYDHLVAGHKQVFVFREPNERYSITVRNLSTAPIGNVTISQNGKNHNFYVDPLISNGCAGVTLGVHEECYFLVQWIPVDLNKRVLNDVVIVSGETDTDQLSTALFLKAVQD